MSEMKLSLRPLTWLSILRIPVALLFLISAGQAQNPIFENSDFSKGNLENWTIKGESFGSTPATAPINPGWDVTGSESKDLKIRWDTRQEMYRQTLFTGYTGPFANSHHPKRLDRSTGELVSVPFVISDKYICFSLAGGDFSFPGRLAVNLLIDGRVRRQAIPEEPNMDDCCFDVTEFRGREAQIVLVDEHPFFGGWLASDEFTASDLPNSSRIIGKNDDIILYSTKRSSLQAVASFLNIPAQKALPDDAVKLWVDGTVVEERMMAVADKADADFWQFIDLTAWKRKNIEISFEGWSNRTDPLSNISQDDHIKGLDQLYTEKFRPQFHYTTKQGWSNDVNGTVYYDGEYHLFYQYDPSQVGQIGRNMHWGHAVSEDLFHWEELPIALGTDPVRGQNYSGSAIVDFNNSAGLQKGKEKTMIAFYTRRSPYYLLVHDYGVDSSSQCMAYSVDRGRTWTHVEKPLVSCVTTKNRDPKVFWHEASNQWIMVFFKTAGYTFYGSVDLFNWEELSSVDGYHECPDIFQLEVDGYPGIRKWVLVNGAGDYSLGEFDGKTFCVEYRGRADFGPISATQTFGQASGGTSWRTQLAWLHVSPPDMPFKQLISLPMDLTLRNTGEGPRIHSNPARSVEYLHGRKVIPEDEQLATGQVGNRMVPWELFDVTFSIELNDAEKMLFEIRGIPVQYDTENGIVSIENGKSKKSGNFRPVVRPQDGRLKIRAILDKCTLDLIVNDGQIHLVGEAYPDMHKPALRIVDEATDARIIQAKFIEMRSIWD